MTAPRHRRRSSRRTLDVKDRLIQTRVPERLESVLKEEAQKRRLTVSHLIRNMLEDTFELVDTVVTGASDLVGDSIVLAEQVAHDAGKIAATVRVAAEDASKIATNVRQAVGARHAEAKGTAHKTNATRAPSKAGSPPPVVALDHVIAWNQVVVNQAAKCAGCGAAISKGSVAHLGVSLTPAESPTWLCVACLARL